MILLEQVTKDFGEKKIIKGINLTIEKGDVVGFLGPNGAGKTTTMRLITGYLTPTSGKVLVDKKDPQEEGLEVRSKIGYLPENNPLYLDLKVSEYLNFISQVKGLTKHQVKESVEKIIHVCGVKEVFNQLIGELSRGYRQRVGLAAALIGDPKILIMDEPTSGLDPNQIIEIRELIKQLGKEKTVILSTHIIPEVSQTCNRIVIIHKGNIVSNKKINEFGGEEEFHALTKEVQV